MGKRESEVEAERASPSTLFSSLEKNNMTGPPPPTSALPAVKALLILDSEGRRITVKYYTKEWCARKS